MSDADIRSDEEHLTRLRAEKNSMKADIVDRKDSIENQTVEQNSSITWMQDSIVDADKIKRAVAEAGAHTQESSPHDFLEPRSMAVLVHVRP